MDFNKLKSQLKRKLLYTLGEAADSLLENLLHYTLILDPVSFVTTLKALYYYIEQNTKIKLIVIDALNTFSFMNIPEKIKTEYRRQ